MGQVPHENLNGSTPGPLSRLNANSLLIIGNGRLAKHLNFYFNLLGIAPQTWNRSHNREELNSLLETRPIVALAIKDDALNDFRQEYLQSYPGTVVHFSGAKSLTGAVCAHPLFTFSDELYDLPTYKKIPFAVTGIAHVQEVFSFINNPSFIVSPEQKSLYHACAVASGNFINLLVRHTHDVLKDSLHISLDHFAPYLEQSLANAIKNPQNSLTGPFVRKDVQTIQAHLQALQSHPLQEIYRSFLKTYDNELLSFVDHKE